MDPQGVIQFMAELRVYGPLIRLPTPWINFTDFHPPYRNIAANIKSGEGGIRMIFIRGISD
jgi:hypothetical protein